MKIIAFQLENFRPFESTGRLTLSPTFNIFTGHNNSGKSSLLRALLCMQSKAEGGGNQIDSADVRYGAPQAAISVEFSDCRGSTSAEMRMRGQGQVPQKPWRVRLSCARADGALSWSAGVTRDKDSELYKNVLGAFVQFGSIEPDNLFVPHLSTRRVVGFDRQVGDQRSKVVFGTHKNLNAKIDFLTAPGRPWHDKYRAACNEIFGRDLFAFEVTGGKSAGIVLDETTSIPLEKMGDGVPSVIAMLADLSLAKNKIFVIEEPENDLHPDALRKLLGYFQEAASNNQFLISTHSNLVLRLLGSSSDSKCFVVEDIPSETNIPQSSVREVSNSPSSRIKILRDLGYQLDDSELWSGWLFFEESSAERITKQFLIPWFAPKLGGLKTYSSSGISNIKKRLKDCLNLFTFIHLQPIYEQKAWVLVDGDSAGKEAIVELRETFNKWPHNHFRNFSQPAFERYYPATFHESVTAVLAEKDSQIKRGKKGKLCEDVCRWLLEQPEAVAREALLESAAEVVEVLRSIEKEFDAKK